MKLIYHDGKPHNVDKKYLFTRTCYLLDFTTKPNSTLTDAMLFKTHSGTSVIVVGIFEPHDTTRFLVWV